MKKLINILLFLLFLTFAVVQYNDPDPFLWMLVYTFVAIVSLYGIREQYNKTIILVGMVLIFSWAAILAPSMIDFMNDNQVFLMDEMSAGKMYVEETRESLGLFLAFLCLFYHYMQATRNQKYFQSFLLTQKIGNN